jgi:hypothetical protein
MSLYRFNGGPWDGEKHDVTSDHRGMPPWTVQVHVQRYPEPVDPTMFEDGKWPTVVTSNNIDTVVYHLATKADGMGRFWHEYRL